MSNVLGIDPGLAHTGAARLHRDTTITTTLKTTPPAPTTDPVIVDARITAITRWVLTQATTDTVLVVIEGPAHNAHHGQPHERAGLWWRIINALSRRHLPIAVLPPAILKGYITGKGNADKELVRSAVAAAWPDRGLTRATTHEADAVALATAGADWLGRPGPWLEGRRGTGWLDKAQWPDRDTITERVDP